MSPDREQGAFPKIKTPPHRPRSFSSRFVPEVSPQVMLSLVEVKIIGALGVPTALIWAPLATIKAEARDPVPGVPLMIVPASMVRITPVSTTTF